MLKWFSKIRWTVVLAVTLMTITGGSTLIAFFLEGPWISWLAATTAALAVLRIETLVYKIDKASEEDPYG